MSRGEVITTEGFKRVFEQIADQRPQLLSCDKCKMKGFLGLSVFFLFSGKYCGKCVYEKGLEIIKLRKAKKLKKRMALFRQYVSIAPNRF